MNNIFQNISLIGSVVKLSDTNAWVDSPSSDPWINTIYKWNVEIDLFGPQAHGDSSTRIPMAYDALDVKVGDWIADIASGKAVKIISVLPNTTSFTLHAQVEDVERYNIFTDPTTIL
jgi:hypothetical protein